MPIKAADTFIVGYLRSISVTLSKMQDQKSLMLHWRFVYAHFGTSKWSYCKHCCLEMRPIVWLWVNVATQPLHFPCCNARSRWCVFLAHSSNVVATIVELKGGWQYDHPFMSPPSPCIWHDVRTKIIDAPLTLIFRTCSQCYQNHVLPRKVGNNSIMSQACSETLRIINDAMPKMVDAPLILIFRR